ncbi:MAG: IS3 family transposase [Bradymonadales bacterium]
MIQSMSRRGNCYDNAVMESFFAVVKTESFINKRFKTVEEFENKLADYLDYYNHSRIKKQLGWKTPIIYRLESLSSPQSTTNYPPLKIFTTFWIHFKGYSP